MNFSFDVELILSSPKPLSLKIDWGSLVGVHLLQIVFPTEMAVPRATLRLSPLNSALLVCDMQEKFR
ncbi:unnamed protein product [Brugia timori]|uniref:Uncharacterized protein n=1 Tax=Brugia timori TaxID=42155 RepID=A0A0R3QC11_9BILA|nr:unnamed protein product [Brugia timori]